LVIIATKYLESILKQKKIKVSKEILEHFYKEYNHRKFVHPDPLEFLYDYPNLADREIVALVASSLAYGRVAQILKSVSSIISRMNPSPSAFLTEANVKKLAETYKGFKHRFTTEKDIVELLFSVGQVIRKYKSLYKCFMHGFCSSDENVLPAICNFIGELMKFGLSRKNSLIASPEDKSACKRLNLFMRWMVRRDNVDPGGWKEIPASKIIVPVDVHMFNICSKLGLATRKQANLATALEITANFARISPDDPVKYDFSLTRLGIRSDADYGILFDKCGLSY
jgi:uncharacterized protein (TIGR02757 family)